MYAWLSCDEYITSLICADSYHDDDDVGWSSVFRCCCIVFLTRYSYVHTLNRTWVCRAVCTICVSHLLSVLVTLIYVHVCTIVEYKIIYHRELTISICVHMHVHVLTTLDDCLVHVYTYICTCLCPLPLHIHVITSLILWVWYYWPHLYPNDDHDHMYLLLNYQLKWMLMIV